MNSSVILNQNQVGHGNANTSILQSMGDHNLGSQQQTPINETVNFQTELANEESKKNMSQKEYSELLGNMQTGLNNRTGKAKLLSKEDINAPPDLEQTYLNDEFAIGVGLRTSNIRNNEIMVNERSLFDNSQVVLTSP